MQTQHVAPRRDGICGNSDGSETAIGLGIAPGVFELYDSYENLKQRGWWDGITDKNGQGFTLESCIENGKPTWVDLCGGTSGLHLVQENRDLVNRLTNRIGYHFLLQRASFPSRSSGPLEVELTWLNPGVAPNHLDCAVAVALVDDTGRLVATVWPGTINPHHWYPGRVERETAMVSFPNLPPGRYRLALAPTPKADDPKPFIRLGSDLPMADGWYVLGTIEAVSR